MSELPKYTLVHNHSDGRWDLVSGSTGQVRCSFATKADATKGGALEAAVGILGGSVKIRKVDGTFQDERSYPGIASSGPPR